MSDRGKAMTRDDIIRMAREANADKFITENFWIFDGSELERFAALVAAAEREACAVAGRAAIAPDRGCRNEQQNA
jgi:uncharacterized protein YggL (DUF469 family)